MRISRARVALIAVDAFSAVTAVGGGIALATGAEGDRFPVELLRDTPFRSYLVPGLILAGAVGGSATVAAVATLRSPRVGGPASVLAGAVMMGWIAGEIRILKQPSAPTGTEVFYFAVGLLMAGLGPAVGRAERRRRSSPAAG